MGRFVRRQVIDKVEDLMGMRNCGGVLPGVEDIFDDGVDTDAVPDLGEDEGAVAAHEAGVAFHD